MKYEKNIEIKQRTNLQVNKTYEAESLEMMLERIITSGEPIDSTSPIIYTEKNDGVRPEFDIRTDIWEVAQSERENALRNEIAKGQNAPEETAGSESTDDTE